MQRMKGQADFSLAYILRANEDHTKVDYYDYDTFEAYEEQLYLFRVYNTNWIITLFLTL